MARPSCLLPAARLRPLAIGLARAFGHPRLGAGLLAVLGSLGLPALAGPQGANIVAGQANVQQNGALTTVNQASQRAVIDWRSFNVAAHETVRFNQPSAQSATLNRVLGSDPSGIFGRVESNGQIFLVNPNGIVFGRTARIDVGALVASTANVSNSDFMAGRLAFTQPGKAGAQIVNEGSITVAEGGLAALVGSSVSNHGVILARLGKVALAAGEAFTLDLRGDQLIHLVVSRDALDTLTDASGQPLATRLDHSGQIMADGGVVQLSVTTASRLVDSLIYVSGDIRATSAETTPGRISLRGDSGTRLTLAGALDTSGERGGRIEVTAREVGLAGSARLDASGVLGGGAVSVGGDWQGRGALPNAQRVDVASGAQIDASARQLGHGGTVVVWADGDTRYDGQIRSRGGAEGGNGGQVEVSGKGRLAFDGDVDAAAVRGQAGMLLLDPTNLIVDGAAGQNSLPGAGAGDFTVRASAINRQLQAGTSVTLQADNDITVNANAQIDARGGAGVAGGGLKLDAGRHISLNGYVILNNGRFEADARSGSFTQAAGVSVATGTGAVNIAAAGAIGVSNLLSTGAVSLTSRGGAVQVSEALGSTSSSGVARLSSLTASGTRITLSKDALVQGAVALTASAGTLDTATLDSRTGISLQARDAVSTGALLTPGAVQVTSTTGAVSLGAVASEATDAAGFAGRKAAALTVRAAGTVAVTGASLGAGGLRVDGASGAGSRASAASFSAAGIFSSGAVAVNTSGDITFAGTAGVDSAAALSLDSAAGSITTGSGALKAAGNTALNAGAALTVGTGGVLSLATGNDAMVLSAAGAATLGGRVESHGAVRIVTAGAAGHVLANADLVASGITVTAGGRFQQAAAKVADARGGALSIHAEGAVLATNLFTTDTLTLTSTGAGVSVGGALGRADGSAAPLRLGALRVDAATDVALMGGALVAGTTQIHAGMGTNTPGQLSLGGTLDSVGAITLAADHGISTQALMGGSTLSVTSGKAGTGAVTLGPVSGSISGTNQTLGSSSPRAGALTVRSAGDVVFSGGAAVASLSVTGLDTAAGSRAGGSVAWGGGSVFSTGAIDVAASGDISFGGGAGINCGAALRLESGGNLTSAAGGLHAGGAVALSAANALTVGSGGLLTQAVGAQALVLNAGGVTTLQGKLQSAGAVQIAATGASADVLAQADIAAASGVRIDAGGRFEQLVVGKLIDAGSGPLTITTAGPLLASNLLTTGAATLTSTGASVSIREALGRDNNPLGALTISAASDVLLAHGALVGATATQLSAGMGSSNGALTLGGALDSRGSITLRAHDSISAGELLSPGAVMLTSLQGGVTIGAVASAPSTATNFANSRAGALTVRSDGAVALRGGAAVASLTVAGVNTGPGSRAGHVSLSGGSVHSTGAVAIDAANAITLSGAAGIVSEDALRLDSAGVLTTDAGGVQASKSATLRASGALTVGSGGVQAGASGSQALVLRAGGVLTLDGKLQSSAGETLITTAGSGSDVRANAGIDALGLDITSAGAFTQTGTDRVLDARSGALNITSTGALSATHLFTTGAMTLTSTGASVKVDAALGRAATRLGSLTVEAATDIELGKGALVAGTTKLTAGAGTASLGKLTLGATLDGTGKLSLTADNGVDAQALMSAGDVEVSSSKVGVDSVKLGAVSGSISGEGQTLDDGSAKAGAVTVRSAGDVALSGGVAARQLTVAGLDTSTSSKAGGSLTISGGSLFTEGKTSLRSAGALSFVGTAGIDSDADFTLESGGAIMTGAGGLKAATTATLAAATALTVGSGGVQAGASGNDALKLNANGVLTLDGKLEARSGQVVATTVGSAADVQANAGIDSASVSITAGGGFTQGDNGRAIDAASGALNIDARSTLTASNLFTAGAMTLTSRAADVTISQALGRAAGVGNTPTRLGTLSIQAATHITLAQGALVAGSVLGPASTQLTAATGGSSGKLTLSGTLDSLGGIQLQARNAVITATLLSPGAVTVSSTNGPVTLGAVASEAVTAATFASKKADALTVRSGGDVALTGGAAVASLLVAGPDTAATSRAGGAVSFSGGSVFSTGDIKVRSVGNVGFVGEAGMASATGKLTLESESSITTARGLLNSKGELKLTGSSLTLGPADAAGTLAPDPANPCAPSTTGCPSGGLTSVGNVTLTATAGGVAAYGKLQTSGGIISIAAPGDVELNHVSTWQPGTPGMSSGELVVSGANVVLKQALGGADTGYDTYALGYQNTARPAVGRVDIAASKGAELNGLNLDGNNDELDTSFGLRVHAAERLISNDQIAVNKGAVELIQARPTGAPANPVDGVYLGHNVYSRGIDLVTPGGRVRRGYDIKISGQGLVLFDNTKEFADVAKVTSGFLSNGRVAKIIVANNPANYRDDLATTNVDESALLEPLSGNVPMPKVVLAGKLMGVVVDDLFASVNPDRGGALRLSNALIDDSSLGLVGVLPRWMVGDLSLVITVVTRDDGQTQLSSGGPLLKILTFRGSSDTSSSLPVFDMDPTGSGSGVNYFPQRKPDMAPETAGVDLRGLTRRSTYLVSSNPDVRDVRPLLTDVRLYPAATVNAGSGRINMGIPTGWRYNPQNLPDGWDYATGYSASNVPTPRPTSPPVALYFLSGTTVDARADGTRVVITGMSPNDFFATASNSTATIRTNASGLLQGTVLTGGATTFGGAAGANNSGQGFAAQGGFGGLGAGGATGSTGNGNTGTGVVGQTGNGSTAGASGNAVTGTGSVVNPGSLAAQGGNGNNTLGTGTVQTGTGGITAGAAGNTTSAGDALGSVVGGAVAGGAGNSANPPEPRTEGEGSGTTPPVLPAINGDLVIDRNGTTLADILLGRRPAADADLGRTGSGSGIAAPVFQRRYRLGTSSNAAVCAPADLQTQAAASGSEAPPCAAAK